MARCRCRPVAAPGIRHPRPAACWPDDALDLAEALLVADRTDLHMDFEKRIPLLELQLQFVGRVLIDVEDD